MYSNVDFVVTDYYSDDGWLDYAYATKPGYIVGGQGRGQGLQKKKGSPGGEFIPHPEYGSPIGESFYSQNHPDATHEDEKLLFWNPKKLNTKGRWEDLKGLKIASRCEYMRRVGDGVPEWVEVADRREGDWMVPCVVLEGGAIVYPKNPRYPLVESGGCRQDDSREAPSYAWSSSGPPKPGFMQTYESCVVSEDLLKSAIHAIKIASKVNPPAEAAEVDDASSKKSKRKADAPTADGETPEKKPKVDSAEEKEKEKPISTLSVADFGTPGTD